MKLLNRQRPEIGFGDEGTGMIALALFVILLAFFIMLSGMTGFAAKNTEEALDSVRAAFGIPQVVYFGGEGKAVRAGPQQRPGSGTADIEDVAAQFEHEVPGLQAVLIKRSGVLNINIPLPDMNRITGLAPDSSLSSALRMMADYIRAHPKQNYQVWVMVHARDGVPYETAPLISESMLPRWVAALVAAGLPAEQIRAGVKVGLPGAVSITIIPQGQGAPTDKGEVS